MDGRLIEKNTHTHSSKTSEKSNRKKQIRHTTNSFISCHMYSIQFVFSLICWFYCSTLSLCPPQSPVSFFCPFFALCNFSVVLNAFLFQILFCCCCWLFLLLFLHKINGSIFVLSLCVCMPFVFFCVLFLSFYVFFFLVHSSVRSNLFFIFLQNISSSLSLTHSPCPPPHFVSVSFHIYLSLAPPNTLNHLSSTPFLFVRSFVWLFVCCANFKQIRKERTKEENTWKHQNEILTCELKQTNKMQYVLRSVLKTISYMRKLNGLNRK